MRNGLEHGQFGVESSICNGPTATIPPAEWKPATKQLLARREQSATTAELGTKQLATRPDVTNRGGSRYSANK